MRVEADVETSCDDESDEVEEVRVSPRTMAWIRAQREYFSRVDAFVLPVEEEEEGPIEPSARVRAVVSVEDVEVEETVDLEQMVVEPEILQITAAESIEMEQTVVPEIQLPGNSEETTEIALVALEPEISVVASEPIQLPGESEEATDADSIAPVPLVALAPVAEVAITLNPSRGSRKAKKKSATDENAGQPRVRVVTGRKARNNAKKQQHAPLRNVANTPRETTEKQTPAAAVKSTTCDNNDSVLMNAAEFDALMRRMQQDEMDRSVRLSGAPKRSLIAGEDEEIALLEAFQ